MTAAEYSAQAFTDQIRSWYDLTQNHSYTVQSYDDPTITRTVGFNLLDPDDILIDNARIPFNDLIDLPGPLKDPGLDLWKGPSGRMLIAQWIQDGLLWAPLPVVFIISDTDFNSYTSQPEDTMKIASEILKEAAEKVAGRRV